MSKGVDVPGGTAQINARVEEAPRKAESLQAQASRFGDIAALYRALGGGWWNRASGDALPAAAIR